MVQSIELAKAYVARIAACAMLLLLLPTAAFSDGEFVQLDYSEDSLGLVAAIARDQVGATASHTDYDGGSSTGLSLTFARSIDGVGTLKFGPSVGWTSDDTEGVGFELGGRLVFERWSPTDFGHIYLLGEINTIDEGWFVLSQFGLESLRFSAELSAGGSVNYQAARLTVLRKVYDSLIYLRIGHEFTEHSFFVGISVNTF